MKTKKKKYLPLYEKWMEQGRLDGNYGLCYEFDDDRKGISYNFNKHPLFEAFFFKYFPWGQYIEHGGEFGALRQTIVLFLAAMNGEID